ncbi:MAG: hypothetical protein GC161_08680 [Planctomycetaceae bacterium]|nr:hypothetical protein [Planctomycetaceae bacterium]
MVAGAFAWLLVLGVGSGADPAQHVEASLRAEPAVVVVEQPFELVLDLWIADDALRSHLVQLSAAQLDVPVDVRLPWLDGLDAVELLADAPSVTSSATAALNGARGRLESLGSVERGGRPHQHYILRRRFVSPRGQTVRFDAEVRYASTSGFEPRLFGDPVPLDRTAHNLALDPVELVVQPWPEAGRPADFAGAVGRFELATGLLGDDASARLLGDDASARLLGNDASAGVLSLWLEVRGTGNLARLEAPLIAPPGFHVLGWLEPPTTEPAETLRRFHYELSPLDGAPNRITGLELAYLDPGPPPTYRRASAPPIELGGAPRDSTESPAAQAPPREPSSPPLVLGVALGAVLGAAAFWLWRHRRKSARA